MARTRSSNNDDNDDNDDDYEVSSDDDDGDDDDGKLRNEDPQLSGSAERRSSSGTESVYHSPLSVSDRGHPPGRTQKQQERHRNSNRGCGDRERRYDDRGHYSCRGVSGGNRKQLDSTEYIEDQNGDFHHPNDERRRHGGNRKRKERPRQERPRQQDENDDEDNGEPPRKKAMSYRTAPREQQKHVAERISILVKGPIFRKMKIISSEKMLEKAYKIIVDTENPADPEEFIRIYKTCIVGGINSKRSSCEQAGQRIVKKLLSQKGYSSNDNRDPPYSMETILKLRQSETEHEKEAFQWFIGEFVASVAGNKLWGRNKYYHRVSEAVIDRVGRDLVVTPSDEAFAILIYENYIEKWIARFHKESRGEKTEGIMKGKYTSSVNNECMYGGWSMAGIKRYNELSSLVNQDRQSERAKAAEDAVLLALRREKFGNEDDDNMTDPQEGQQRVTAEPIEAYCEL
jgi:hypothetical protein